MSVLNVYSKEQVDQIVDNKEVFYNFTSFEEFRDYLETHDMKAGDKITVISYNDNSLFTVYAMITAPKITNVVDTDVDYLLGLSGVGSKITVIEGTPTYLSSAVKDMTMIARNASTTFNLFEYSINKIREVPITMNNSNNINIYITSKE